MYTIGQLARKFGISRSTLLFYDAKGLLKPAVRTESNYRRYTEDDAERLKRICLYRETGLPLEEIKLLLDSPFSDLERVLEKHLDDLNRAFQKLQIQRRIILNMMKHGESSELKSRGIKHSFLTVLHHAGICDAEQEKMHAEFERLFPDDHQTFLESLGIPPLEIKNIREYAKRQSESG